MLNKVTIITVIAVIITLVRFLILYFPSKPDSVFAEIFLFDAVNRY